MYIADLHIHSRYSRATSQEGIPEQLELWARKKGIRLLGTGDFTHPAWREELRDKLVPAEEGFYTLKEEFQIKDEVSDHMEPVRFVVTGEISSIYKQGGRVRKVHSLLLLPGLEEAELLSGRLEQIGNIYSDGRPILGLSCHDLLEIMLEVCPQGIFIPAHIWTPHFSLLGAFSGFDSIEECFGDLTPHIHALETGLSSDPPMNWRLSQLDGYQLVSNSDAHSPAKLGREANLLDTQMSYPALFRALETGEGLYGTIEFFPEEGKYHFDGHRKCHLCLSPAQAKRYGGKCPVCGRKLTIGVSHRVEELADREEGYIRPDGKAFESLVPLTEVIGASIGKSATSAGVQRLYRDMLRNLGNEFAVLREMPIEDIRHQSGTMIAEGISRLRQGQVERKPGFDGEYGTIRLFEPWELDSVDGQMSLFLSSQLSLPQQKEERDIREKETDSQEPSALRETAAAKVPVLAREGEDEVSSMEGENSLRAEPFNRQSIHRKQTGFSYLERLNEAQREAAVIPACAVAVTAGPGTGKTGTLTARILYLLNERGVKPSEITAVTFTNKAAAELRERLERETGGKKHLRLLNTGTFHSICLKLLREQGFDRIPVPEEMLFELAEDVIKENSLDCRASEFLRRLSLEKSRGEWKYPAAVERGDRSENRPEEDVPFQRAAYQYQNRLEAEGGCDFDDLLLETLKFLKGEEKDEIRKRRFSYLLVDEFQDVNPLQFQLIQAWNRGQKELFVIGDPDQAIYGFRGSDPGCFHHLERAYPSTKQIVLRENYRCVPSVLEGAQALISENPGGERTLFPVRRAETKIRLVTAESGMSEAIFAAKEINRIIGGIDMLDAQERRSGGGLTGFSDIAVMYRTHRQAALLEKCLQKEGIPYQIAGRDKFLADPKVRGSVAFFRSLMDPKDGFSSRLCRRLLWRDEEQETGYEAAAAKYGASVDKGKPQLILEKWIKDRGWEDSKHMEKLLQTACLYGKMNKFLETLVFGTEGDLLRPGGKKHYRSDAVTLMTIHASKGLEFSAVILCGVRKGVIPLEWKKNRGDQEIHVEDEREKEEERRLFYVGMTRARDQLILLTATDESEFLSSIPEHCMEREKAESPGKQREPDGIQMSLFDWICAEEKG